MYMKLIVLFALSYTAYAGAGGGNTQLNGVTTGTYNLPNSDNTQLNSGKGSTRGLGGYGDLYSYGYGPLPSLYGGYGYLRGGNGVANTGGMNFGQNTHAGLINSNINNKNPGSVAAPGPVYTRGLGLSGYGGYGIPQYGYGPVPSLYGGYGYLRGYGGPAAPVDDGSADPQQMSGVSTRISNTGGLNFGKNTQAGTINSNIANTNQGVPVGSSPPSPYTGTRGLYGLPQYGIPSYGYGPVIPSYGIPYIRGYGAAPPSDTYQPEVEEYTRKGIQNTGGVNMGDNTKVDKINSNINNKNNRPAPPPPPPPPPPPAPTPTPTSPSPYNQQNNTPGTRGLGIGSYGGYNLGGYGYGPINYGLPQYGYGYGY